MSSKTSRNTRGKIISAAWDLFYQQGYEETTVDEIVEKSETSKGSFYHYFESKDALLGTLSYMFDEKYVELEEDTNKIKSCYDKLLFLNKELFAMIENSIDQELLSRLLSTQLITKGERHLLDRTRTYYKALRNICIQGQESGEFTKDMSVNDMVKLYSVSERGLMYDWCICGGEYSLTTYSQFVMGAVLEKYKSENHKVTNKSVKLSTRG